MTEPRKPELADVSVIPALVSPPDQTPDADTPRGFSDRMLDALGRFRVHPVTYGNRATVYRYGRRAYNDMLAAIDGAEDHVNLGTYIFQDDETGHRFADAVEAAVKRGVVVNVIADAVGCWGTPDRFFDDLKRRGVHLLVYHPVRPWRLHHAPWILNRRYHRKILVVDGRVGFTGGMNIGDEYASDGETPGRWRDTHCRIEGPAVRYLQRTILSTLFRKRGDAVPPARYLPNLSECGDHAVRVLPTTPFVGRPYVRIVLRRALAHAEKSIHMTQAYFVPDFRVLWSLRRAAGRGVDVQMVVPSNSDVPLALSAGRSTYGRMLRSGVTLHERQGPVLHAKSIVVDGEWSILGSANMDIRSFRINLEVSVDILGRDVAADVERIFADDVQASVPIDLETWSHRPWTRKFAERFAGFFRELL
ncbi:MAG: phospholipase D-like domain-containing protein [Planctomycetota bacterium]|jgi:cardiolipin synthase